MGLYVVTGKYPYTWKGYEYRYINFNFESKKHQPKIVTGCAHRARSQVYFMSREQAESFLQRFITPNREMYNLQIKEYEGDLGNSNLEIVVTKYGDCLKIIGCRKL